DAAFTAACDAGVVVVTYDSAVQAPCVWNLASMTGALPNQDKDHAFFGAQNAAKLAELINGKGNIFMNRGAAGATADNVAADTAKAVFAKYPDIHVVDEYFGNWTSATAQQLTTQALAAHPDVAGVWSVDGEIGVVNALKAAGKEIPVVG